MMTATNPTGMPAEIFLYEQRTKDPATGAVWERFLGVASKSDLNTYPVGQPDVDLDYPFYRKSQADLEFDSATLADEAVNSVVDRINVLVQSIKAAACLDDPVIYSIGDEV